jgi:FkbM family methyltransferase
LKSFWCSVATRLAVGDFNRAA